MEGCPANGDVCSYSLIKLEGVEDIKAANFYLGKKVAFVYRAKREVQGSKIRVIWGKVTRTHGMFVTFVPGQEIAVVTSIWPIGVACIFVTNKKKNNPLLFFKITKIDPSPHRQLGRCPRTIQTQSPPKVLRCQCASDVVPIVHLSVD